MTTAGTDLEAALRIDAAVRARAVCETRSSGQAITALDAVPRARDARDAWRFAQRPCGTSPTDVLRTVHSFDACAGCAIHVALEGTD